MSSLRSLTLRACCAASVALLAATSAVTVHAQAMPPVTAAQTVTQTGEAFIKSITSDVFAAVKADKSIQNGDVTKLNVLVDTKVMPYVNFARMTASAVGPGWRQATPEQRKRLQTEFKTLLLHTYAGAASQVKDVDIEYKPSRNQPEDTEVVVRTQVKRQGEPIQLDYRLEKTAGGWKIYDVNVMGAWLVQTYQSSFAQEINATGVEGLINKLVERNKQLATKKAS